MSPTARGGTSLSTYDERMTRDELLAEIRRVARDRGTTRLSRVAFCLDSGLGQHAIYKHFDRWSDACQAAGIECESKDQLVPNPGVSRAECLADIKRVAKLLDAASLSAKQYRKHGKYPGLKPIYRHFQSWRKAARAAGLDPSPYEQVQIPFEDRVRDFLAVAVDLGRIPTIKELQRRTRRIEHISKQLGGYANYKAAIARHYLGHEASYDLSLSSDMREAVTELAQQGGLAQTEDPAPHRQGRVLGFRQFAFAPTQEQDVVALFNAVADDLGFEILSNRSPFPDCLARRRSPGRRASYMDCRIEYEFSSRDYERHKHPLDGCDLIVCWIHDWPDSPIEVLELQTAIRQLKGWK